MRKKVILGAILAVIAAPALWFGADAYSDYRNRICVPNAETTPS